jgi:Flp pilus assembly protein CpaB
MKYLLVVLFTGLLAACSSDPSKTPSVSHDAKPAVSEADAKKGVVCTYEVPVGSMIRQKKCTTLEERERELRLYEQQLPTAPAPGTR